MAQDTPINTLEFANPTESLPGAIEVLSKAPPDFNSPVVLNCHLYGTKVFYDLAGLITDVWLPDLRYGNDQCARELSGVTQYMDHARLGLEEMQNSAGRIIVRILVLPGHVQCCHEPSLRFLSEYKDKVCVSVLDQYVPEHKAYLDSNLRRRPTREEIEEVNSLAMGYGLKNVSVGAKGFWTS